MENFVVSARKYRPASFETVIGQGHVVQTLKNAIKNKHVAHAFLFCGPRGVGKTTSARLLAKTINCSNLTENTEACNECESCRSFNNNSAFNIYELDAASNNSVDDIRALVDQVRYAPQGAQYKIYIIDEVHMLSSQAFNAFLKTLEEPPPYAKFILATTEKHKILPTILSRCQTFDFHRIRIDDAVKMLKTICEKENIEADEEALHVIAQKADGAMRDALSIFDRIVTFSGNKVSYNDVLENLNILDYDYYFRATNYMLSENLPGMLLLFDEILSKGFDSLHFLEGFSEHFRNLMVCKYPDTYKLLEVASTVARKFQDQAKTCSSAFLLNGLNLLNQCELQYKASRNQRLHVELTLMKLSHLQSLINLKSAENTTEEKKKSPQIAPKVQPNKPTEAKVTKSEPEAEQKPLNTPPVQVVASKVSKLEKLALQINKSNEIESEAFAEPIPNNLSNDFYESFSEEQLKIVYSEYIDILDSSDKSRIASFLRNAPIEINSDTLICIKLRSNLELQTINEERLNLIPFFRQKLKNMNIDFIFDVCKDTMEKTIELTKPEQLKQMIEQNPTLGTFVNKFGLEIDY